MIHIAKSLAIKLSLLLIVLAGLLVGAMQLGAPAASHFRGELEQWIGGKLQRPVRIGSLAARWRGLGPEFVLKSVEIDSPAPGGNRLVLNEVRISLALVDSLRAWALKTRNITLSQVKLRVTRHANGTFSIGGLDEIEGGGKSDSTPLFALPSRIRLEAAEIHFVSRDFPAPSLRFAAVAAELRNAGDRHQLDARLPFPGGGDLELRADIRGDISQPDGWGGKLYVNADGLRPDSLLQLLPARGLTAAGGHAALQLWGSWERGRFVRAQGTLELAQLDLARRSEATAPARRFDLDKLRGRLQLTSAENLWRATFDQLQVVRRGRAWPVTEAALEIAFDDPQGVHLLAGANFLRAEDLVALGQLFLPLGSAPAHALDQAQPRAELRHLRFEYRQRQADSDWSLQGNVESFSSRPWKQAPGITDLDAGFWVGPEQGTVQLAGRSAALEFPRLFRDPLQMKRLEGQLRWQRHANGDWQLLSPDILAVTHDISTHTRLDLTLPADPERSPFLDLQTDFADGRAINAHRYYPVSIMPEPLVAWLDRGIVDGKVVAGAALVRGPLHDFPFHRTHNGRFEVFFQTENTIVDYWPGWPRINDIRAEVRFLQNSFDVWIEQGRIFDSELQAVHGRIDDLAGGSPITIAGQVTGPLQNHLRILRESPLAGDFAAKTEGIRAAGNGITKLALNIPLSSEGRFALDGAVGLNGGSLQLQEWQLTLDKLRGSLGFTHRGMSAEGIQAGVAGSSAVIDIATSARSTRVGARAGISSAQLAKRFPTLDLTPLQGSADWTLQLDIPHGSGGTGEPATADFRSDLRGMRLALPAPLGKQAAERRDFNLSLTLDDSPARTLLLRYDDLLDATLQIARDGGAFKLVRGTVTLGGNRAPLRDDPGRGLALSGSLARIDMDAWLSLLTAGSGDEGGVLDRAALKFGRMTLLGSELRDVAIELRREAAALNAQITSDRLAGRLRVPHDLRKQPLRVRLQRLAIDFDPDAEQRPQQRGGSPPDPAALPSIDLAVEKTRINDHNYGQLQLLTRPLQNGLELQRLSLDSKRLNLAATGRWLRDGDGQQRTLLDLSLNTPSFGRVLRELGYPRYIDDAPAKIEGRLHWPGTPAEFAQEHLLGVLELQLEKGRLVNVDPGIGRVFGLVNVTALQRRLSLDFTDLFKKGLIFDSIGGRFELDNGDAYTNDFRVIGPAAMVESSGRIGLADKDLDQLLTVTPHLSAALPVAGLIAGGPLGGAAMLLAQGLIGKEFDKASQRQYEVKGSWSDPQMTPLNNADGQSADQQEQPEPAPAGRTPDAPPPQAGGGLMEGLKRQFTPGRQAFPEAQEGELHGQ